MLILSRCWATGRGRFQSTSAQSGEALKALGMGDGSNNGGHSQPQTRSLWHSTPPPPQPPPSPTHITTFSLSLPLAVCHNFPSPRCLRMSRVIRSAPSLLSETHLKSFLFLVSPCHMCTPTRPSGLSPSPVYLWVHLSGRSDTSLLDCVRLGGVQVFRHSL